MELTSTPLCLQAVYWDNFTFPYCGLDRRHTEVSSLRLDQSAVPWLRQLVASILPQRPGLDSRPMHVKVMD